MCGRVQDSPDFALGNGTTLAGPGPDDSYTYPGLLDLADPLHQIHQGTGTGGVYQIGQGNSGHLVVLKGPGKI